MSAGPAEDAPAPKKAPQPKCDKCGSWVQNPKIHLRPREDKPPEEVVCIQLKIPVALYKDLNRFRDTFGYPSRHSVVNYLIRKALYGA